MKKIMQWVLTATLIISGTSMQTACSDVVKGTVDGLFEPINKELEKSKQERKQTYQNNLYSWNIGSTTDQDAVNKYGYEKCFSAIELTPRFCASKEAPVICPGMKAENLRLVRFLFTNKICRDNKEIGIGAIVCNKSIADDVQQIFRQLYESNYDIHMPTTAAGYCKDNLTNLNCTYSYFYDESNPESSTIQEQKGMSVVLNASTHLESGDKAVVLFKQKGFIWGGDTNGGNTCCFERL